jgi:hypothetical protein
MQGRNAGTVTTSGRREFSFYAPDAANLKKAVTIGLSGFKQYRYKLGQKQDPGWTHYLQLLYPSDIQLEKIANRDVLELLEKQGDAHEIERDVSHWAYLERENDRDSFKQEILRLGYAIDSEHFTQETNKYCLSFKKKQAVTPNEMDESVVALF